MSLKGMVLGLTMVGLASGAGYVMTAKEEKDARVRYGLSAPQVAFMKDCKSTLSAGKKTFKNTTPTEGCACIAGKLGADMTEADYRFAGGMQQALVKAHGDGDRGKGEAMLEAAMRAPGMSPARAQTVTMRFLDGARQCLSRA